MSNPIEINRDFVIAGYNLMIGRTADEDDKSVPSPASAFATDAVVQIWASPLIAGEWLQDIVGDHQMVLDKTSKKKTNPGNENI